MTAKKKRGPGRPPGSVDPNSLRQGVVMRVRIRTSEKEELQAAADSEGQDLTVWVRETCLREARRKKKP